MQQHVPSEESVLGSLPKERGAPAALGSSLLLQRQEDAAVADSPRQVTQQQVQEGFQSGPRQTAQRRRLETLQLAQAGAGKTSSAEGLPDNLKNGIEMQVASPPIQRVEIPIAETTGTEYDASKHTASKTKARELFENLPGPTEGPDDFTWHHIVPQSHISKAMADNPMMIRLGPSSSYRIDDPGNEYTDPNYLPDGTHTPFSEAVEAGLREPPRLDHAVLAEKLKALLAKHSDIKDKAIADPGQWHIAIDQLAAAEGLTREEVSTLQNLSKPTTYFVKGEKREDEAIAWSDLEQSKLARYEGLFGKLDKHIKANPKVFFRGFQQKDETAVKMFRIARDLRKRAEADLAPAINSNAALRTVILRSGKVLVFKHQSGKLGAKVGKAIEQLVKGQGLGSWGGKAHSYYSGGGEVHVDNDALRAANATRQDLAESGVGEDKPERLVTHTITGHVDASEAMMSRASTTVDNVEIPDVASGDVPGLGKLVKSRASKGFPARDYIVIDAEEERIVTSGDIVKKYNATDRKRNSDVREIERLQLLIKGRKKDLDAFNKPILEAYRQAEHEKRINAAKLIKFREVQQSRIADVNSSTARYSGYTNDTGAAEAQREASSLTNTEFLERYWPDWAAHITQFKKKIGAVVLAPPAVVEGSEPDFTSSEREFAKQTHALIAEAVETVTKDLKKSITAISEGIDSSAAGQRAALIEPTPVTPDMLT